MRCFLCGWIVTKGRCPCGANFQKEMQVLVPIGSRVLARAGRGPSMNRWERGEVQAHLGAVHRVDTPYGTYWCEGDDLVPDSPRRADLLVQGTRVWALWLDGRWYPGTVDGSQGPLRHIAWDDGDAMWTEAARLVVMVPLSADLVVGQSVQARRWDGGFEPATLEQEDGGRFLVTFLDGEEAWVTREELKALPPNPFIEEIA